MSDMTLKGVVSLDTSNADQALAKVGAGAKTMADGVKKSASEAGSAVEKIGDGASASAKKVESAERSIVASIQRRTAAIESAGQSESKYYENLAKQRGVNVDALRPYLQQLDAAKAKQDAASASLGKMGISANQTAAALRSVPAQFTDIVTSLQGGQAPLTVLLQQGGQLKDMFGGVGNAARALGGYVAGLITPFTVAGAALAALAVSAYKGSSELQAFNKTLILSGGQAGVSSDQLMSMAQGIDAISTRISQSKAADTLNEIVNAGVRGEAQIRRYALAAAEFEAAGGGAAAEVAKQFAELGKDPLAASVKLTQSMGYLTAETYKQIKALEDQGRTLEAARVAQEAYASALEGKTPALLQNLGLIERAWNSVKNGAKEAWDAMLNVGRQATLSDQVAEVEKRLAAARANPLVGGGFAQAQGRRRQQEDELLLSSLREQQRLAARSADQQAARVSQEKARISWMQEGEKYLSKEAQMEREIAKIKAQGLAAGASEVEIEKRISALREKNAKTPRAARSREGDPFASDRAAAKEWADYIKRISDIAADAEGKTLGLSKAQQELVQYLQSPAYGQVSESMRQYALQTSYAAIESERLAEAARKEAQAIQDAIDAMAGRIESQQGRAADVQEQIRRQQEATEAYGLSNTALVQLEASRLLDAAAERERQAVIADGADLSGMLGQAYRDEAAALRDLAAAKQADAQKRASVDAAKAAADEWQKTSDSIEAALTDALMRGFENGKSFGENLGDTISNYFKTIVAKEIAAAITKAIMSALASTQWGQFISGALGGGGGLGNIGGSLLSSAVQSGMGGGSALGSSASAAGAYFNGSMSGANAAGSIYANYTGAGLDGLLATNSAYGTASAGSAAGASSASWISAVGYAALIAAAVVVAENLYSKGYNRTAVGVGPGTEQRFMNTSFTSDPRMGRSPQYDFSTERLNRELFDFLGMSEKWADIFSGTTRMGTLFGRKLGAYGFEADIAGGQAEVGGFARYKGGLFRSNKTVDIDVDPRDAAYVEQVTEAAIEGARGMARALGYSSDAIDKYTGSIRVNMKGADTAEEQAKRMAESMEELSFELLKTASGGKLAKAELEKMMEGVRQSIQNAGISVEGITGVLTDGIVNGLSGEEIGANLSQMILGGIVQTFAQQAFAPVAQAMMTQIITPIFTAIAAGVPISQAVSKVAIQNIVETAKQAMEVMNAIFNSAEMQEFFGSLNEAFAGVGNAAANVRVPNFRPASIKPINTTAQETAREREQLERELLRLQGNTTELRRRELNDLKPSNRALQERIWALEDERAALEKVTELQDAWKDLTNSIEDEIKRLRNVALGDGAVSLAYVQAQFATTTAQARAMDQEAAARLPELSGQLADLYLENSTSRSDYQARVNVLAASLEETNRITRNSAGIDSDGTQKVKDENLANEIKLLQQSIDVLTARMEENNKAANATATALNKASSGSALRTVAA